MNNFFTSSSSNKILKLTPTPGKTQPMILLYSSLTTPVKPLLVISLARVPKVKIQISFCKILKNNWYHTKVLLKRFHLNGHITGFGRQTQKLELLYTSCLNS